MQFGQKTRKASSFEEAESEAGRWKRSQGSREEGAKLTTRSTLELGGGGLTFSRSTLAS